MHRKVSLTISLQTLSTLGKVYTKVEMTVNVSVRDKTTIHHKNPLNIVPKATSSDEIYYI